LFLATGQLIATFAYDGVIAIREASDVVMDGCRAGCIFDLCIGSSWISVA
jgi:hypothetical protein